MGAQGRLLAGLLVLVWQPQGWELALLQPQFLPGFLLLVPAPWLPEMVLLLWVLPPSQLQGPALVRALPVARREPLLPQELFRWLAE